MKVVFFYTVAIFLVNIMYSQKKHVCDHHLHTREANDTVIQVLYYHQSVDST